MDLEMSLRLLQTFDWKDLNKRIYEFDIPYDELISLHIDGVKIRLSEKIRGIVDNGLSYCILQLSIKL